MAKRILIVDDHEIVRLGLRSLLEAQPDWMICGEASDGLEAIERARLLVPDVILMDISMPRMDGLEASRVLRRDLPGSRIVIISQNDPGIVKVQAKSVGAVGYVAKSTLQLDLIPMLESVFGQMDLAASFAAAEGNGLSSTKWLSGGGELGRLIRARDWLGTPLGPLDTWPQALKTSVNLILNSQHPMWLGWGPEATFLYNDAYIPVLSLAKHPWALGKPAAEVWSEIWSFCGPLVEKVFRDGESSFVDDVQLFMNRGGFLEETYYSFSYSPVRDESGTVVGLFCPSTNVTPRTINARRLGTLSELSARALTQKTAEAACASAAAILATNPADVPFAALYLVTADGRQAALQGAVGLTAGWPQLSPDTISLDAADRQPCLWPVAKVAQSGRASLVRLADVKELPIGPAGQKLTEAMVLPVTSGGDDRPLGVLVAGISPAQKLDADYRTFFDLAASQIAAAIQNAHAAEEEQKRIHALAEIDRAKTAFFSNVSHEFRTPLTLMLGPVEELLARSHTDLTPATKMQLELVNRNGARLLRLVNTLLDFSRIEAGRIQAIYQGTDLPAFTAELASVFRSATEKAGLRLNIDCRPFTESVFIDRSMWEKIVLNLISNAFKFTFEGAISVSLEQAGPNAELRVTDTGVGIPAAELARLFERFHRVENARSRTHEGSGIGLALVQELVKLHGGSVNVESKVDRGTTFIVTVPMGRTHLPSERIQGSRPLMGTSVGAAPYVEEALRWLPTEPYVDNVSPPENELIPVPCPPTEDSLENRPHVLLADDNADMRHYVTRLLAERYRVDAFADGEAALAAAREEGADLILTDVMMPHLDGFGLLRQLRADPKTRAVPVILLSARAGEESRLEGLQEGADDYLIKPFSARELLARVQTHIELARVRQQAAESVARRTVQFETLLNEAPMGVYLVDADFRVVQANPVAEATLGPRSELIGKDFGEVTRRLLDNEAAEQVIARFRDTLATGERYYEPERRDVRSGAIQRGAFEWQISRIQLPDGRYGVVCYYRDITRQVESREAMEAITASYRKLAESLDGEVRSRTDELEKTNGEILRQADMLREFSQRLMQAQDDERRRIARELHDSSGQLIAVLSMHLETAAQRLAKSGGETIKELDQSRQIVQQLSQEIRTMSYLLHPPLLDEIGLAEALRWYIDGLRDRSSLDVQLEVAEEVGRLPRDMELVMFRLVQESLTNIHRHSGSKTAFITVRRDEDRVTLEVRDEGHGIAKEKLSQLQSRGSGVGIRGMNERVRQLGGDMNIHSSGNGTTILFSLPVRTAGAAVNVAVAQREPALN